MPSRQHKQQITNDASTATVLYCLCCLCCSDTFSLVSLFVNEVPLHFLSEIYIPSLLLGLWSCGERAALSTRLWSTVRLSIRCGKSTSLAGLVCSSHPEPYTR